jgi:hypothetical protein
MSRITLKHSLATVIVAAGVFAAAGTASLISYGHAGLGASTYQHNQTDPEFLVITDGTSNTTAVTAPTPPGGS